MENRTFRVHQDFIFEEKRFDIVNNVSVACSLQRRKRKIGFYRILNPQPSDHLTVQANHSLTERLVCSLR